MLKETEEAPSVIRRIVDNYFDGIISPSIRR
jgi:hypothetical protein